MWLHAATLYKWFMTCSSQNYQFVTRFIKRGLIHAKFQDTLFMVIFAIAIDQWYSYMSNTAKRWTVCALTQAFFPSLSHIHKYLGGLLIVLYPLDKQSASCNSPHDWLMSLAMDLAALCDMWRWKWYQWMPFGYCQCGCSLSPSLCGSPPFHPMEVLVVLDMPV